MTQDPTQNMPQVILGMFVMIKTIISHDASHPLALKMAERLHDAVAQSSPGWSVQFIRGGVFKDRNLIELGNDGFGRAQLIARALENLGFHEIVLAQAITTQDWLTFGTALARGALGPSEALENLRIDHLSWRTIPNAAWGAETEDIDPEIYAISQIANALTEAEDLEKNPIFSTSTSHLGEWPWQVGLGILRRLERALEVHERAAVRALEMNASGWPAHRRSVSVAFETMRLLRQLRVSPSQYRASAHFALALGFMGFDDRGGDPAQVVAKEVLQALSQKPTKGLRTGMPPHHLKVCSLAHLFAQPDPMRWIASLHLVQLLYELERERCPPDTTFDLTRADLLALAAREMGTRFPHIWVKALVDMHGAYPVGGFVRLGDGDVGVILDERAGKLDVLAHGNLLSGINPEAVALISSFEANA